MIMFELIEEIDCTYVTQLKEEGYCPEPLNSHQRILLESMIKVLCKHGMIKDVELCR